MVSLDSLCLLSISSLLLLCPQYWPLPGPPPPHQAVIYSPGAFISGLFLVNRVESFQTGTGWWPLRQQQWGEARPDLCGKIWDYIEECLRSWLWRACSIIYGVMWWCERPRTGHFKESSTQVSNMEKLAILPLNILVCIFHFAKHMYDNSITYLSICHCWGRKIFFSTIIGFSGWSNN